MTINNFSFSGLCNSSNGIETLAIIIDSAQRIVAANQNARDFIQNDCRICIRFGRLEVVKPADIAKFNNALEMARKGNAGSVKITIGSNSNPLSLEFVELSADEGGAIILLLIKEINQQDGNDISNIIDTYGLTPSEARLLEFLYKGCNVPQAAQKLQVAYSTARSHLQHVFDKTGVRRQTDLMRLFNSNHANSELLPIN